MSLAEIFKSQPLFGRKVGKFSVAIEFELLNGIDEKISSIRFDEGLTLETSAFQSLYGGQFTLSTPLINQIFVYHSPIDAAPQFLQKLIAFTLLQHSKTFFTMKSRFFCTDQIANSLNRVGAD